jgi:Outer membrane protein and related peptidoglycan-associated (lipo)proteins
MRVALYSLALAFGLIAQACAAKSYVVLLKSPFEAENHVHIINKAGVFGINNPGYGTVIDRNIQTVHRYEPAQIDAEFGDALESMSAILAAGLPSLPHSYTALLALPQGPLGKIVVSSGETNIVLEKDGLAMLIDGFSDEPFQVGSRLIENDFGSALQSMNEIIEAGFRPLSYIVLLEDPDGGVGKVIIDDARGKALIDEAGKAVDMGAELMGEQIFKVDEKAIKQDFGQALDSTPILPAKYVIEFQSGGTRLAMGSQAVADKMLEDVKTRPAPVVSIDAHADTVGKSALNEKLSRQRAELVARMIRDKAIEPLAMEMQSYGERRLFINTPDNTPEIRNRRWK